MGVARRVLGTQADLVEELLDARGGGGAIGLGTSPGNSMRWRSMPGSGTGIADNKAWVYGCRGAANSERLSVISTICPRYITAMRLAMCLTTARSCAMKM